MPELMATINNTSKILVRCNRCQADTYHVAKGQCEKRDRIVDDASKINIDFKETYTLLQCQACGQACHQSILWNSENDEASVQFFPPSRQHRPPVWLNELEDPLPTLLQEVYEALDAGMHAIALMGVRAVLDVWVSSQTSHHNNFCIELKSLADLGRLSPQQVKILEITFDAGSGAAHRGFLPKLTDAVTATEAVENLLHQSLLVPRIDKLKSNTPLRK